jgi:hypothetical protein
MLSRDVGGAPMNNTNNGNKCSPPVHALGRARRPREDGPRRGVTKQNKRIKSATGPIEDKMKTRALVETGCCGSDSDDIDAELLGKNEDTSHAEALSDSTYCEGDLWPIKKSSPSTTRPILSFLSKVLVENINK